MTQPPENVLIVNKAELNRNGKDRVSSIYQLTFEHCCIGPLQFENKLEDLLNLEVQPVDRWLTIEGTHWRGLVMQWMTREEGGRVVIEVLRESKGALVIAPQFVIRPGRFVDLEPLCIDEVQIRCLGAEPCKIRQILFSN